MRAAPEIDRGIRKKFPVERAAAGLPRRHSAMTPAPLEVHAASDHLLQDISRVEAVAATHIFVDSLSILALVLSPEPEPAYVLLGVAGAVSCCLILLGASLRRELPMIAALWMGALLYPSSLAWIVLGPCTDLFGNPGAPQAVFALCVASVGTMHAIYGVKVCLHASGRC